MVYTLSYAIYALLQGLLGFMVFRYWSLYRKPEVLALMLPMAAVVWDNSIIALGSFIGEGPLLTALTYPRFWGHAFITPIWIPATIGLAIWAGGIKRNAKLFQISAWALYGSMVLIGILNEIIFFEGELVTEGDVLYITNVGRLITPPPPSLVMMVVSVFAGTLVFYRRKWPWLLVAPLGVLVARMLPSDGAAFVFVNSAEVIMSALLFLTLRKFAQSIPRDQKSIDPVKNFFSEKVDA